MGLTLSFVDTVLVIVLITMAISIIVERICRTVEYIANTKAMTHMYEATIKQGKMMNIDEFMSYMVGKSK